MTYCGRPERATIHPSQPSFGYLREDQVREVLPPGDICAAVARVIRENDLQPGFVAEARHGELSVGARSGFVGRDAFGIKVRAGAEGRYLTLVWDGDGHLGTVVESAYLTYLRTAALLMLVPHLHGVSVARMLIMGTGRLGSACCSVASVWYPAAQVYVWSRSADLPRVGWPGLDRSAVRIWAGRALRETDFDIITTCTPAREPLPLRHVRSRYVGVAGAVRPDRRELPDQWPRQAAQLCSDLPARAVATCGDLAELPAAAVRSLSEARVTAGSCITFVCGNGAIDTHLAWNAWSRVSSSHIGSSHGYSE